jgi:DNA-binding response OmpR family regulator
MHTPVLMLTTSESETDRRAAGRAENLDFSVKPFALEDLVTRVRSLVRNGANAERRLTKEPV